MSKSFTQLRENLIPAIIFVILGLGFLAMFAGTNWFWMIWVFGFAVVIPLLALIFGEEEEFGERAGGRTKDKNESKKSDTTETVGDPLITLRDRYARGELTDEQFEHKLDQLLATETLEDIEYSDHERLYEHE